MNHQINRLLNFGLEKKLISEEEVEYAANLLLDLFQLDSFYREEILKEGLYECTTILEKMLDYAVSESIIEDTTTARDLFDTKIMNCIMPRPSEIITIFNEKYQQNPSNATDYYYALSIASNYIRKSRTDKNIRWKKFIKYGNIEISINVSKPEKDPKEIAKAKSIVSSEYPKCLLCKENVGFSGDLNRAARQTHRIIPLQLEGENYYLQYSPYVYYDEHCIIFNEEHKDMIINHDTFSHLLSFLDQFPHYMVGSNADLPIVGGSILTHDHYQGGRYTFPIESAKVLKTVTLSAFKNITVEIIHWPLSTIRITSSNAKEIIDAANRTLEKWISYSAPSLDIVSHTNGVRHNTITPIARMKQGLYQLDLVLRNNRTSEKHPDGIFHPHFESHHIKKENIGLIEVMGLAILPARLKDELKDLKTCLLGKGNIVEYPTLEKHIPWYQELSKLMITDENIDTILEEAVASKFVSVLEDAGVFKMDQEGIDVFISFVESLNEEVK